jgi:hypothetical protein
MADIEGAELSERLLTKCWPTRAVPPSHWAMARGTIGRVRSIVWWLRRWRQAR